MENNMVESADNYGRSKSTQPTRRVSPVSSPLLRPIRSSSVEDRRTGSLPQAPQFVRSATGTSQQTSTNGASLHPLLRPSTFKTCLKSIAVPYEIVTGMKVIKINDNGKIKFAFLTLSDDKFTLNVTTSQIKNKKEVNGILRPMLKKVTSIGSSNDNEYEYERVIDIGSIIRIQKGQSTLKFELARKQNSKNITSPRRGVIGTTDLNPNKCFSIFFVGGRTADFEICDEKLDRDRIVDALERLMQAYAVAKLKVSDDVILLRYVWIDVDRDKSDSINSSEFASLLNRINYMMKRVESNKEYDKFAKLIDLDKSERRAGLTFDQCSTILHRVKRNSSWMAKPVRQIFFNLFGEKMNNGKTRENVSKGTFLSKFMLKKQGESNTTIEDVENIFRSLHELEIPTVNKYRINDDSTRIDLDRFEAYLRSSKNDIFDPAKEVFDINSMNRPISEYWIHSSHNTYLCGDQWKSNSSVEMYMEALYRGCRCLELDCWDGERDENQTPIPDIYHGHTITSRITFRDVILAIKVFLNGNPDCYPLVLSLENHCSIPFQEVMASCMIEIFGESLFIPDKVSLQDSIPNVEALRGKVILKGQRIPTESCDYTDITETEIESDSDDSQLTDEFSVKGDNIPLRPKLSTKTAPELSRITYFHSVPLKNFTESILKPPFHMHSFSESRARQCCRKKQQRSSWITYNTTHVTRTYPSARRVESGNYSPMSAWSAGCQLVAINLQTSDYARRLNDGRFRENGGCGYVLKPPSLNGGGEGPPISFSLYVKILAGYCLPKPKGKKKGDCISPSVQVSMYDIPAEGGKEIVMSQSTEKVVANGFNPIWNQTKDFKFKVQSPDVAMLQLNVFDRDVTFNDFIASSSVPVTCIREGIRSVKLFDANNTRSGPFKCASLLIEVRIKKGEDVKMW